MPWTTVPSFDGIGRYLVFQIVQGASSIDDENREEVDEDETTAATASSFTTRETPMRWKPHDVIKFYRVRCGMRKPDDEFQLCFLHRRYISYFVIRSTYVPETVLP